MLDGEVMVSPCGRAFTAYKLLGLSEKKTDFVAMGDGRDS